MLREAKWEATRGEAAVVRGGALTKAARLAIAAATFLIFPVLPLHAQKESVLYSFSGPPADGGSPSGSLVRDNVTGDLYGTTQNGGPSNFGIVFKLHPNGDGSYTETVLYSFDATSGDGQLPVAGLVIDGSGNLYGTTQAGGGSTACQFGCGTVFELVKSSGSYTEKVLHSFTGAPDGQSPGSLSMDTSGNLYGTTEFGGSAKSTSICKAGCGAVFELANNSGSYTYSVLFSFSIAGLYGMNPAGSVVIDSSGNLYGTTPSGGHASACGVALGCGVVYELVNSSGVYAPSVLYNFVGVPDGELPGSNLILDAQGNLYGTASGGVSTACSSFGCGAVFKLHPNGGGSYTESLLYSFTGSPDGQYPGNLASGRIRRLLRYYRSRRRFNGLHRVRDRVQVAFQRRWELHGKCAVQLHGQSGWCSSHRFGIGRVGQRLRHYRAGRHFNGVLDQRVRLRVRDHRRLYWSGGHHQRGERLGPDGDRQREFFCATDGGGGEWQRSRRERCNRNVYGHCVSGWSERHVRGRRQHGRHECIGNRHLGSFHRQRNRRKLCRHRHGAKRLRYGDFYTDERCGADRYHHHGVNQQQRPRHCSAVQRRAGGKPGHRVLQGCTDIRERHTDGQRGGK